MKESATILNLIKEHETRESNLRFDIDQLTSLNSKLRIAEEKSATLNSIIENTDDAIISNNLSGVITSWNNAACRIFGYGAMEIVGKSIFQLIPLDRLNEESTILKQLKKGIRVDHFETKRLRKDGSLVDVSLTISPILNSDGVITGLSKIVRDLTSHRAAETQSNRLAAIVASSDDAIISKNLDGIVTSWNDSAKRIFGYSDKEMIGYSILKIIPLERYDEEPKILEQLRKGIRVDHFETERLKKDGSLISVSLTISPIKDQDNQVVGVSKIARDITDKKILENKKNEFIDFVSHELKTPLTSLKSYIQVALHKSTREGFEFISQALVKAELQTKKLENMISDFLTISKFENGQMKLNLTSFDLVTVIRDSLNDARIASAKHPIVYCGVAVAPVSGDQEKLLLVLTNLLSNAQKYSPNGGLITLDCQQKEQSFLISVTDQGLGISNDDQKMMFKKFFRVSSEQTKFISGFGIGLYLVSTIINLHGSTINIKSEPGLGSTFSFMIQAN
ncbi:PAS domain S-box protein [Pedobacter mucosus]|uniref:PAS domain S-box protein n=1 Tax=Pedobacter mucosus TaxID=2895286 RepID=UPI001EE4E9C9|nr:PAS domain S-box protein [Pedobacter mucosus]UKT64785.1 PAS domain S-box protein [Pedobacter mucosus]